MRPWEASSGRLATLFAASWRLILAWKLAAQAEEQNCDLPVTGAALRLAARRHLGPERQSLALAVGVAANVTGAALFGAGLTFVIVSRNLASLSPASSGVNSARKRTSFVVMLHRRKLDVEEWAAALAKVLESLDIALISLDAQRRVRYMNRLAESLLRAKGPLSIQHGRIRCNDVRVAVKLDKVLAMVCGQNAYAMPGASIIVPYDHRRVYVRALPLGTGGRFRSRAEVLLTITDVNVTPTSREHVLAELFGLTPSEIRVAMLMVTGLGAKEISQQTGATHHTVRFQLKSIYRKTGAARQSQLVRLISMLPGQLEAVPPKRRQDTSE